MMSSMILRGIGKAKQALGGLVVTGILDSTASVYNVATGVNEISKTSRTIDAAIVKLDYVELSNPVVAQADMKLIVFNADQDLNILLTDKIWIKSVEYSIIKVQPVMVGTVTAVYEVYLRR